MTRDRIEDRALLAAVAVVVAVLLLVLLGACAHSCPRVEPEPGQVVAPLTCMTGQRSDATEFIFCASRAAVCEGAHTLAKEWDKRLDVAVLKECKAAKVSVVFAPDKPPPTPDPEKAKDGEPVALVPDAVSGASGLYGD